MALNEIRAALRPVNNASQDMDMKMHNTDVVDCVTFHPLKSSYPYSHCRVVVPCVECQRLSMLFCAANHTFSFIDLILFGASFLAFKFVFHSTVM